MIALYTVNDRDELEETRTTPSKKAKSVLADHVDILRCWEDRFEEEQMTEKELWLVRNQLQKLCDRVARMCGETLS